MSVLNQDEALQFCDSVLQKAITADDLEKLCRHHFLPSYQVRVDGEKYFLENDLRSVVLACGWEQSSVINRDRGGLFGALETSRLVIHGSTAVDIPEPGINPAYYAATRNLMDRLTDDVQSELFPYLAENAYFSPTRFSTTSEAVSQTIRAQLERARLVSETKAGEFANSAHYMGAKRAITPFLVEALSAVVPPGGIVVDLMCGSGSVAGACARIWPVIASDAQKFSRYLAVVQGGGLDRPRARALSDKILVSAREHAADLASQLRDLIDTEDRLLHSGIDERLRADYADFIDGCPLLDHHSTLHSWNPQDEVRVRRKDPKRAPYILFTAYFANIYFGLRQSIEIDSLRYGVESITDPTDRAWALGALVASVSKLATSFGGHFAQPLVTDWRKVGIAELGAIIEKRSFSVFHEFAVRLLNLADESSRIENVVRIVPGPWKQAVDDVANRVGDRPVVVYFDPPYRREEYSRYYHLLETLVVYAYPAVEGRGRLPRKDTADRFRSEFFTRSESRKLKAIVTVITAILDKGWTCAWSYSNVADVSIPAVLREVAGTAECSIRSVSVPHRHHMHGAKGTRGRREVTEYLVVLEPRSLR